MVHCYLDFHTPAIEPYTLPVYALAASLISDTKDAQGDAKPAQITIDETRRETSPPGMPRRQKKPLIEEKPLGEEPAAQTEPAREEQPTPMSTENPRWEPKLRFKSKEARYDRTKGGGSTLAKGKISRF